MKKTCLLLLLAACGAPRAPLRNTTRPSKIEANAHARSLAEAMRARQLEPISLETVRREMTSSLGMKPHVEGRELVVMETAGYTSERKVFARRGSDGAIVIVSPRPHTIVDREVDAGCRTFAGGRAWFEEVRYRLPPGESFGGIVEVPFEEHVEVPRYADKQPDGSPCPPPAVD